MLLVLEHGIKNGFFWICSDVLFVSLSTGQLVALFINFLSLRRTTPAALGLEPLFLFPHFSQILVNHVTDYGGCRALELVLLDEILYHRWDIGVLVDRHLWPCGFVNFEADDKQWFLDGRVAGLLFPGNSAPVNRHINYNSGIEFGCLSCNALDRAPK